MTWQLRAQFLSAPHERRYGEGLHQALRLPLMAFQRDMGQLVCDGLSRNVQELKMIHTKEHPARCKKCNRLLCFFTSGIYYPCEYCEETK